MAVEAPAAPEVADSDSFENFMGKSLGDIPDFVVAESEDFPPQAPAEPVQPEPEPGSTEIPEDVKTDEPAAEDIPSTDLTDKLAGLLGAKPTTEEPATEPEKPAEVPDEPPPPGSSPAAQKRWAEMRQDVKWRKEHEPKLQELTKELEDLRAKVTQDPAATAQRDEELKTLQRERDEYLEEIRVARVEASPEFKQHVAAPMAAIDESAKALAKKYEVSERDVIAALRESDPDKQSDMLAELATNFNERDKVRLFNMGDQRLALEQNANYIRSNAKIALESLEKSKAAQVAAEQKKTEEEWTGALDTVSKDFRSNLPLLQPIEGQEEWNKGIEEIDRNVRQIRVTKLDPAQQAKLAYQALVLPRALTVLQQVVLENQNLKTRLGQVRKIVPGAGGGSPSTAPAADPNTGFLEAIG